MSPELAMWLAIVGGGVAVYVIKLVGHLLPEHWLAEPRVARTAALVTVALLAALVAIQTFASGHGLTVDARLPALVVAAIALALRAPFLLVVVLGAATAALVRALGWMP